MAERKKQARPSVENYGIRPVSGVAGGPVDLGEDAPTAKPGKSATAPRRVRPVPVNQEATPRKAPAATSKPSATPAPAKEPVVHPVDPVVATWDKLRKLPRGSSHLERNRIIAANRRDPAHAAFDVLRTKLLQVLADRGWSRVAITSPSKDCGKTFVAANLAVSLSRQENCRSVLMDLDLRNPSLARIFGVSKPGKIGDFLRGDRSLTEHFMRFGPNKANIGQNLALAFNSSVEDYASELLQSPGAAKSLEAMTTALKPDVVLFDMPPALYHDDVIAFRPRIDGVLLVVGGGITRPDEVQEVERRLGEETPLLGVILNRAEGPTISAYSY